MNDNGKKMKKIYYYVFLIILISFNGCGKKPPAENIYESEEYKNLTRKDITVGESIWAIACFRCHRYGTNGATILEEKEYWDKAASKGIDELFKSVWDGKEGNDGIMPAKGFCNLCSEEEIRKSVFYMLHLAKKAQAAHENKSSE
tara:strand:+ start:538 stop:972 length:435 start_codon:yes stop_codon:yes gene_type:complete